MNLTPKPQNPIQLNPQAEAKRLNEIHKVLRGQGLARKLGRVGTWSGGERR